MKKFLASLFACTCLFASSTAEAVTIFPSDNHIQYFGRWEKTKNDYSCGYGATYIKANFYGTDILLYSAGDHSWWRYSIDGAPFNKFKIEDGKTVMAKGLEEGKHSLLLVRSTEGEAGISHIYGFELNDGGYMMASDKPKERRLEFVGDSISAGACNDGPQDLPWYDKGDNDMAYGPQLARMLDADYSVSARSGEGVIHNYGEKPPYNEVHTADRYAWVNYSWVADNKNPKWDFSQFPVDAVLIELGTNDFSLDSPKPEHNDFVKGYVNLVLTIHQYNPEAKIICIEPLPSNIHKDAGNWINEAVNKLNRNGYKDVYYIPVNNRKPLLSSEDYVGDDTHPTAEGSRKFAEFLKDRVAKILNW